MAKNKTYSMNVVCPHCGDQRRRLISTSPAFVTCNPELSKKGCGKEFLVEWIMVPEVTTFLVKRVPRD